MNWQFKIEKTIALIGIQGHKTSRYEMNWLVV
jgi:hypothetical protein